MRIVLINTGPGKFSHLQNGIFNPTLIRGGSKKKFVKSLEHAARAQHCEGCEGGMPIDT